MQTAMSESHHELRVTDNDQNNFSLTSREGVHTPPPHTHTHHRLSFMVWITQCDGIGMNYAAVLWPGLSLLCFWHEREIGQRSFFSNYLSWNKNSRDAETEPADLRTYQHATSRQHFLLTKSLNEKIKDSWFLEIEIPPGRWNSTVLISSCGVAVIGWGWLSRGPPVDGWGSISSIRRPTPHAICYPHIYFKPALFFRMQSSERINTAAQDHFDTVAPI